ncbi:MAG TPA: hypothetical protein VEV17_03320 [Bryobacteraceae bacterium]|nr:hypothetical protein [Bryobacteraceae bacterium]
MNEPPGVPKILIVDDDVGLVWWLGELFHEAGYQSLPALGGRQALALVRRNRADVDLLIVNPGLSGVPGLIETLSRRRSPKVVFIAGPRAGAIPGVHPVATLERPSGWEPISRFEWRQKLQGILKAVGFRAAS